MIGAAAPSTAPVVPLTPRMWAAALAPTMAPMSFPIMSISLIALPIRAAQRRLGSGRVLRSAQGSSTALLARKKNLREADVVEGRPQRVVLDRNERPLDMHDTCYGESEQGG